MYFLKTSVYELIVFRTSSLVTLVLPLQRVFTQPEGPSARMACFSGVVRIRKPGQTLGAWWQFLKRRGK